MPRKFFTLFLFLTLYLTPLAGFCDDFPGKGDRFAWSNALPYFNRGNKYLEHGRYEEAQQDYEEAIYRYEYDPDFYINYGVTLRKRENYIGAEQAFRKSIELRPNDWQAWSNLANTQLKQNKLKETIACFEKAMKMQPPPPQDERIAILKDIADIKKILSMQAPPPGAARAKAAAESKEAAQSSKPSSLKKLAGKSGGASKPVTDAEPSQAHPEHGHAELKKSGWDWVN
ncbi:MAG: tetratricopeptide repeat protein [Candidatus Obscuribacterales bacterium]|nr:tetratricopeptide repeat protein [Candidatus Obscuribacterales bacterium]